MWVTQGDAVVRVEARYSQADRTCRSLAQIIIQAHKTKRQIAHQPKCCDNTFRSWTETPVTPIRALPVLQPFDKK